VARAVGRHETRARGRQVLGLTGPHSGARAFAAPSPTAPPA
jgi:hypothetical protein